MPGRRAARGSSERVGVQHGLVAGVGERAQHGALEPRSGRPAARSAWSGWVAITTRSKRLAPPLSATTTRPRRARSTRTGVPAHAVAEPLGDPRRRTRGCRPTTVVQLRRVRRPSACRGWRRSGSGSGPGSRACRRRRRPDRAGERQQEVVAEVVASSPPRRRNRPSVRRSAAGSASTPPGVAVEAACTSASIRRYRGRASAPRRGSDARHARGRRRTRGRSPRSAPRRTCRCPGCATPSSANSRSSVG